MENIICSCNSEHFTKTIIAERNYSFRFLLLEQLKNLLENFDLTSDYPGNFFKKYLNMKKDIFSLSLFIDGVLMFLMGKNYGLFL